MATVYLGLGSNQGDRKKNLHRALELLSQQAVIQKVSSVYETEPVGYKEQPNFLNAVCRITTELEPEALLKLAKKIETGLGRKPSFPNAPRPIDIDILFYDDEVVNDEELVVPHPKLAERAFVLLPLTEIAPSMVHPVTHRTAQGMLAALGKVTGVRKSAESEDIWRWEDVSSIS